METQTKNVRSVTPDQQRVVNIIQSRNPMLLTREVLCELPSLYANEQVDDPVAVVKYFTPSSGWTWFVTEGSFTDENGIWDGDPVYTGIATDFTIFGAVDSGNGEKELGYASLMELSEVKGPLGLKIERDLHWKPTKLSECR